MGYYTRYTLEHDVDENSFQEVGNCFDLIHLGDVFDNGGVADISWYEHEANMLYVSMHFPEFTFTLTGIGDEPADMWKKRFRGGEVEEVRAEIVWPEFKELV
jgi:hypothetical protein